MFKKEFRVFAFTGLLTLMAGALLSVPTAAQAQQEGEESAVQMTEYSDYQCPACAYYYPIVKKLKEHFGEKLEITYKFFPLNSHQYGALSARAAQAAKNQGKYLEMHNLLFEGQQRWSSSPNPQPIFLSYAREIGLDIEQFKQDLNAVETQRTVMEEKQEGVNRGVNATPTFFVNGEKLEPAPQSFEEFRKLIESSMQQSEEE